MDEQIRHVLHETGPILCMDIGALTQNVILARPGFPCENWPRWTLPSSAQLTAQRIRELSLLKHNVWLYGDECGGGFSSAIRDHLKFGLKVFATPAAASSIHDNLSIVQKMGVQISDACPPLAVPLHLADINLDTWIFICRNSGLPQPHMVLAAAQDHGEGNRQGRNKWWREILAQNPDPVDMVYETVPPQFKRLRSLQSQTGGPVADSAVCAILGALCDNRIFERSCRDGITFIHLGNAHTVAALIYKAKIFGIYEHHTNKVDLNSLLDDLKQFRLRWLPSESVQNCGGAGTAYCENIETAGSFEPTFVSGPQRMALQNYGLFMAPRGDMLHAGCLGLLYAWCHKKMRSN